MRVPLVLLLVWLLSAPASAQRTRPDQPMPAQQDGATIDVQRFRLADQYLRAGQTERAIALLEDLYAESPAPPVYVKLKQAYEAARRFGDVVALIEQRRASEGESVALTAEHGVALHQAGLTHEATAAWQRAVALAPDAEMTYRTVSTQIGQIRLYTEAVGTLRAGRERLGTATLFQLEIANLCTLNADYTCATEEYLAYLADHPDGAEAVQARLSRLVDGEGAADALDAALGRAVRRDPLNRAYRELSAWIAMERHDYAAALDANLALDRLENEQGQSVYGFAEAAAAASAFEEAERAYAYVLERHADGPVAASALLGQARLAERRAESDGERAFDGDGQRQPAPRYEAALAGYIAFADAQPTHPATPDALARAAALQRTVFRDYAAAETLLRRLAERPGDPRRAGQAQLDLGRVALQRGDLNAARAAFAQVEETLRIGPLAEEARIELARLDFYEGFFEGALARAEAMNENTATDVANDAISLKLLLRENRGPDSLSGPLRAYARAALLQRTQRAAEALATLDSLLATAPGHAVADEAAFLRIEALRALGRFDDALDALAAFPSQHPDSYLVERTLFLIGEVHERDLGDPDTALAAYTDLLTRHPGSLLAPEARTRIRRLRGDRPPG